MPATTYGDVTELLGDIDDLFVERIVDTGATPEEVAQALEERENERRFGEPRRVDGSPRVAMVREILEELQDEGEDEALPAPPPAP